MNSTNRRFSRLEGMTFLEGVHVLLPIVGVVAPFGTFLIAVSTLGEIYKLIGLVLVAAFSLSVCVYSFINLQRRKQGIGSRSEPASSRGLMVAPVEAQEFLGGSVKLADIFKLASSRVAEIFPSAACTLYLPDDSGELKLAFAGEENSELLCSAGSEEAALAELAFRSGEVEFDDALAIRSALAGRDVPRGFASSAAIPLVSDGRVFAVFQLFWQAAGALDDEPRKVLAGIGEQLSPLLLGAMIFERSLLNALADPLTGLPNERAFSMILESQLAECQRSCDERPLTVVSIDIRGFAFIDQEYGHPVADRLLTFAADQIKGKLRKMDFLARGSNDEFLLVLPTAGERAALEVLERINRGFSETHFQYSDTEKARIQLHAGWASFWQDGETAQQLLHTAQRRKQNAKCEEPAGVLYLTKDYVN